MVLRRKSKKNVRKIETDVEESDYIQNTPIKEPLTDVSITEIFEKKEENEISIVSDFPAETESPNLIPTWINFAICSTIFILGVLIFLNMFNKSKPLMGCNFKNSFFSLEEFDNNISQWIFKQNFTDEKRNMLNPVVRIVKKYLMNNGEFPTIQPFVLTILFTHARKSLEKQYLNNNTNIDNELRSPTISYEDENEKYHRKGQSFIETFSKVFKVIDGLDFVSGTHF